ncbi:MAG: hypothetical protein ACK4YP_15495 [Myxococcota bacterium]
MLLLVASALAAPPPDRAPSEDAPPAPAFGTDVSAGVGAGALLGDWPDAGVHGTIGGRVDLFMVDRTAPGPRFGASFWGRTAVWPLQTHTDDDGGAAPFGLTQYGVSAIFRFDPSVRWTGTFGFGFGRADLTGYEGGVQAVPTFTVEAGLRQSLGRAFVDYGVQSGWGSTRAASGDWEDWWTVSGGVSVGLHAR